jgi:hypothetical protein
LLTISAHDDGTQEMFTFASDPNQPSRYRLANPSDERDQMNA